MLRNTKHSNNQKHTKGFALTPATKMDTPKTKTFRNFSKKKNDGFLVFSASIFIALVTPLSVRVPEVHVNNALDINK